MEEEERSSHEKKREACTSEGIRSLRSRSKAWSSVHVDRREGVRDRVYAAKETRARVCTYVCTCVCACVNLVTGGWVGRSGGLGSIGHSYGNVSNYRTELLARAPKTPVCPLTNVATSKRRKGRTRDPGALRFAPSVDAPPIGEGRKRNDMIYSGSPSERFWPGAG